MGNEITEPGLDELRALLKRMVGKRIAVIGDVMVDRYLMGHSSRISPEAPVPIVTIEREELLLGGAANVAKCLVALGARVKQIGVIGADEQGDLFLDEAKGLGIDVSGVVRERNRPTTVKSRVVVQNQQMLRLDWESTHALSGSVEHRVISKVEKAVKWADAVVLSDYSKGLLTRAVAQCAIQTAGKRPVVVDPKDPPWDRFRGALVFKPNRRDLRRVMGLNATDESDIKKAVRRLIKEFRASHVVITRSEAGLILGSRGKNARKNACRICEMPAWKREVFDSTGAGDMIAACLVLGLAGGADMEQATWLANVAAGIEVGKFGAAIVSDQEILDALGAGMPDCEKKVMARKRAAQAVRDLQRQGRTVVFTNGCFDLLHYGHVSYLERARKLGDALVVAVNSDASVRRLKGEGRPVQNEHDRLRIMASQACVDVVVPFEEDTPIPLLKVLRPDILCKGGDYKRKQDVVGWDVVESYGGRVQRLNLEAGRSTTHLIKKATR